MHTSLLERDPTTSLDGEWIFAIDPDDVGVEAGWQDPATPLPDGRTVSVPHAWQEEDDLLEYAGVGWYERRVEAPDLDDGDRAFLRFGAVDWEATVYLNGERVGRERDGYLPFAIEVTDALVPGENTITLRVYDPADLDEIPHGKQGDPWYTRVSGPWQSVDLVVVPETHVSSARVTPDLDDAAATIEGTVAGPVAGITARVAIRREGDAVAETDVDLEGAEAETTLPIPDPDYWTPETPALYDYAVELRRDGEAIDVHEGYFGMRSVSVEAGELRLNGEPFAMRGALDQAFYPDTYYRPADLDTFEREIRAAKELGFNLLRKHIKPAHPAFLERADRLGILVWEEPANPTRDTEDSRRRLREQLRGMVERDYDRPSVIAWSIYNEEWGIGSAPGEESLWTDDEKQDYLESLSRDLREWDPTRLVCDNSGWAHVATDLNDYHEYFVVPDRVDAWRDRLEELTADPGENYGDARTDPAEAALFLSEFGTWGLPAVSGLRDHYGGDPHWFAHDFLEGLKLPEGVPERFADSHASSVFEDLDALASAWQRREFESVASIVADVRVHDGVEGYVVTELTDIEWEFNGMLDYRREEKAALDRLASANAPVTVHLDLEAHAVRPGETVTADLVAVNDTPDRVETTVTCACPGAEYATAFDVGVAPHDSERLDEAVSFDAPAVETPTTHELAAETTGASPGVSRSVTVVPRPDTVPVALYAENEELRDSFATRGYELADGPRAADVSVVTDPDGVEGTTLVVPDGDGHPVETGSIEYETLPERESWNLCASFVYQDLLPELDPVPGWAFEGLYPYGYVTDVAENEDVLVGYVEGWMRNEGAVVSIRESGDQPTAVCTLRVTDVYGEHPVATLVCDRLVERLAEAGSAEI